MIDEEKLATLEERARHMSEQGGLVGKGAAEPVFELIAEVRRLRSTFLDEDVISRIGSRYMFESGVLAANGKIAERYKDTVRIALQTAARELGLLPEIDTGDPKDW
jgi:hypothetical protein